MKTIELKISETGRDNLKSNPSLFNVEKYSFNTIENLRNFIFDRYGKIPKGQKMYNEFNDGHSEECGIIYSFWNKDIPHNSKSWYQTDWIEFWKQETRKSYFKL